MSNVVALDPRRGVFANPAPTPDVAELERAPHRRVRRKHMLYRQGQPATSAFVVNAGVFKCTVLDAFGRERVTGFALKGDVLGVECLVEARYLSDVVALDVADVIELSLPELLEPTLGLLPSVASHMSKALAQNWMAMLALHSLDAEQRVAWFLLDYGDRLAARGYPADELVLRMTRGDIGSFLDVASESVVRALTRLEGAGLIRVACRNISIIDRVALTRLLMPPEERGLKGSAPGALH